MNIREWRAFLNIFRRLRSLENFEAIIMAKFDDLDAAITSVDLLLTDMETEISGLKSAPDDISDVHARATKLASMVTAARAAIAPTKTDDPTPDPVKT